MAFALGSKERLVAFFKAKNQNNLVLRTADVLDLSLATQEILASFCCQFFVDNLASTSPKRYFFKYWPMGYVTLPIQELVDRLSLEQLEGLQQVVFEYRNVRLSKGYPFRKEPCPKCKGRKCKDCEHSGEVTVFLEISDQEQELAEGFCNVPL